MDAEDRELRHENAEDAERIVVGEVRTAGELVERPLRAIHAPVAVRPVAEVEVAVRAALAMASRAHREPRPPEEESVGVERTAPPCVAREDALRARVDIEGCHH